MSLVRCSAACEKERLSWGRDYALMDTASSDKWNIHWLVYERWSPIQPSSFRPQAYIFVLRIQCRARAASSMLIRDMTRGRGRAAGEANVASVRRAGLPWTGSTVDHLCGKACSVAVRQHIGLSYASRMRARNLAVHCC